MIGHVLRRSLEHRSNVATMMKRAVEEGPKLEIPPWGVVVLGSTMFLFVVLWVLVRYALRELMITLAMVETPAAAITVSASAGSEQGTDFNDTKDSKEPLLETAGPTITIVHQKPITSKIRTTMRHLVAQTGCRSSRVRGILSLAAYQFCFFLIFNPLFSVTSAVTSMVPASHLLAGVIASALTANLHAAWTHKVIAMPNTKSFYQRIPSRSHWKSLALPAAVATAMPYLTLYLVKAYVSATGLYKTAHKGQDLRAYSGAQWASLIARCFGLVVVVVACELFFCLPATAAHVRVEASLLPEDDEAIVPFDRTFAGKVVPRILGGSGALSFRDAWKHFDRAASRRVVKLYLKGFAVSAAMGLVMLHVLGLEVYLILGTQARDMLAQARTLRL